MGLLAQFGIESDGLGLALNLLLLVIVVVWVALVYWTYADARRRISDPMLIACATLASLFPFVGTIVYMIVRPPEYLADAHERELEIAAAEARVAQLEERACPYCNFEIERTFLRCPSCLRRLKEPCQTCGKPLDPRWKICPYCESEIAGQTPRRRAARPSARTASAARGEGAPRRDAVRGEGGARREPPPREAGARREGAGRGAVPSPEAPARAAGRRDSGRPAGADPAPGPPTRAYPAPEPVRDPSPRSRPSTDGGDLRARPR
jgi:hypothetical protein